MLTRVNEQSRKTGLKCIQMGSSCIMTMRHVTLHESLPNNLLGERWHRMFTSTSLQFSLCDFFLFPEMTNLLRGERYSTENELHVAVREVLRDLSKNGFQHVYDKWVTC